MCEGDQPLNSQLRIVQEKVATIGVADLQRRQFSFITGNYRILVISWIIMDLAMEMPHPNFQYYVRDALGGAAMALGLIDLRNFLAMAARAELVEESNTEYSSGKVFHKTFMQRAIISLPPPKGCQRHKSMKTDFFCRSQRSILVAHRRLEV